MQTKRVLKYGMFGLVVFLASFAVLIYATAHTEKREVLLTTSLKIGGQEQKFKAFYLSAPAEEYYITVNVSEGSIKFSPWDADIFEETLGWFDYYNGTGIEKHQVWFFEGNNGTAGCKGDSDDVVIYIQFYNEDSYEKEIHLQVTEVWHEPNYQSWT